MSMINQDKIEIKVGLIGHVSVGKTTVLNALFREKYSEVSMRRTTAGVNYFRIRSKQNRCCKIQDVTAVPNSGTAACTQWYTLLDPDVRTADSTLKEISADNANLRESTKVHEKFFDIEVEDMPCKMHDDTVLVVVDIPGINEAGSESKYQNYAREKWNTFDCVVLVMDGTKGVNDEEQVKFLQFAKENLEDKKDIPVIILCNKIDDPKDKEQAVLVDEAQKEIEHVFQVKDRKEALENLMRRGKEGSRGPDDIFPVFIATSAIHAFIYRTASLMSIEQFKKFDAAMIEKIGHDEVGKWKWRKLSEEEQHLIAYNAVTDQKQYRERLEATNFDKFLTALAYSIGDGNNQLNLIRKQITTSLNCLAPKTGLATELRKLRPKLIVAGGNKEDIQHIFWLKYKELEEIAFKEFSHPLKVGCLAVSMLALQEYFKLARCIGWKEEETEANHAMKGLLRRQLSVVFNNADCVTNVNLHVVLSNAGADVSADLTWASMTSEDWKTVCRSILLLSSKEFFCSAFGAEMILLQSLVDRINAMPSSMNLHNLSGYCSSGCGNTNYIFNTFQCTGCKQCAKCKSDSATCSCYADATKQANAAFQFEMVNGELQPRHEESFCKTYRAPIKNDLADPSHWGYLAWQYCDFMTTMAVATMVLTSVNPAN